MRVRINPAGHDIAARSVKGRVALEVGANGGDRAMVNGDVGWVGQVSGNDGAVFDDGGHGRNSYFSVQGEQSGARGLDVV